MSTSPRTCGAPLFEPLRDPAYSERDFIDDGPLACANGLDLDPLVLHGDFRQQSASRSIASAEVAASSRIESSTITDKDAIVFRRPKKQTDRAEAMAGPARSLAMPLLDSPRALTVESLTSAWRTSWPNASPPTDFDAKSDEHGLAAMMLTLDGMHSALVMMPVPIPNGGLDGPAATSWMWPAAKRNEIASVNAHVVAWISGAGRPVDAYWNLTRLVVAINRATDALGVYWGAAGLVVRADVFDGMAHAYDGVGLPVMLWVDFRGFVEDGRSSLFTVGLTEFGVMELEIAGSNKSIGELREFAMNIATYLIHSGPVLADGHTVGGDENERILVRHLPSMIDREGLVHRLEGP